VEDFVISSAAPALALPFSISYQATNPGLGQREIFVMWAIEAQDFSLWSK
jgi:hypothetical protein